MRVACILLPEATQFLAFAEACMRFSPQIAIRKNEAVFLEIGKCRSLYSEEGLLRRLQTLAKRFGYERIRVGLGDHAPEALAHARYFSNPADVLPIEALTDYASPYIADPDSDKKVKAMVQSLKLLGVRTVADFKKLPSNAMASRFGELGSLLYARVTGKKVPAWPGFHPLPLISEKASLLDVANTQLSTSGNEGLDALLFVLRGLADRAMARLRGKGERASIIQVELELEKWSTLKIYSRKWQLDLPLPQGSATGLLPILREHLSYMLQKEPLLSPAVSIRFEVLESVPGSASQRDLFKKKEEQKEAWNALVNRLAQKLGVERVFVAVPVERYLPERAYERALEFPKESQKSKVMRIPHRPSRILPQPESIEVHGNTLVHSQRTWHALEQLNEFSDACPSPERIHAEWWNAQDQQGPHRDYFRVPTLEGEELWIFKNRKQPGIYLHGFFD